MCYIIEDTCVLVMNVHEKDAKKNSKEYDGVKMLWGVVRQLKLMTQDKTEQKMQVTHTTTAY